MSNRTPHVIDKTGWGDGPWMTEPDKIQWTTKAGLPGMIVRNHVGALCGYAAVNPGHPLYEHGYDDHECDFNVHGGLTYSDHCQEDGVICHVPEPGQPDNVWWFGFDCAHAWDLCPQMYAADLKAIGIRGGCFSREDVYRDLAYVTAQVESLAEQLAKIVPVPVDDPNLAIRTSEGRRL